jgi:hypothetical protein
LAAEATATVEAEREAAEAGVVARVRGSVALARSAGRSACTAMAIDDMDAAEAELGGRG